MFVQGNFYYLTKHCDLSLRTGDWTKCILCSAAVVGSIQGISGPNGQSAGDIFAREGGTDGNVGHWLRHLHCGAIWEHFGPGELRSGLSSSSAVEDSRGRWEDIHIHGLSKQSDWDYSQTIQTWKNVEYIYSFHSIASFWRVDMDGKMSNLWHSLKKLRPAQHVSL